MQQHFAARMIVALSLVAGGFLSFVSPAPVRAATVTANAFFDRADGQCATSGTGECTLREAVIYANANPGTTIQLLAGTYTLTLGTPVYSPTDASRGALILNANTTIVGMGQDASVIDASAMSTNNRDRVFLVGSGSVANIRGVTVRGGQIPNVNQASDAKGGGGILVLEGGTLSIRDSVISANSTRPGYRFYDVYGGGIRAIGTLTVDNVVVNDNDGEGIGGNDTTTIINSTVRSNRGGVSGAGNIIGSVIRDNSGRGVYGARTIMGSTISGNSGGGVAFTGNIVGTTIQNNMCGGVVVNNHTEITNSRIIANSMTGLCGGQGGGIANNGTVVIDNSVIEGNVADRQGGGIYHALPQNTGTVTVRNGSRIVGNRANGPVVNDQRPVNGGGGIFAAGYAVNANAAPRIIVTDSTIADNSAIDRGGGIYLYDITATFTDTTINGNQAGVRGGGFAIETGTYGTSTVPITNTTISGNTASEGGGIWSGQYSSGGDLTLANVTVAGNSTGIVGGLYRVTARNSLFANTGANCSHLLTSNDYNLSSDTTCTAFVQPHDRTGTNPRLGPLANNGGPTLTHALLPGSPAIDAGGTSANGCPATDQRGVPRPQGQACDIGAFEVQLRVQPEPRASVTPAMPPPLPAPIRRDAATLAPGSPPTPNAAPSRR